MPKDQFILTFIFITLLAGSYLRLRPSPHQEAPVAVKLEVNRRPASLQSKPPLLPRTLKKPAAAQPLPNRKGPRTTLGVTTARSPHKAAPRYFRGLPPSTNAGSESGENFNTNREMQDLAFQERRATEFLKFKVGLSEEQIQIMHHRREIYLSQIQKISQLERDGSQKALAYKNSLNRQHIHWMSHLLGPENYREYLHLTTE